MSLASSAGSRRHVPGSVYCSSDRSPVIQYSPATWITLTSPSMKNSVLYAASICTAVSLAALVLRWQRSGKKPPYPPGPSGYPLIGNVLSVPRGMPIWQAVIPIARKHSTFSTPAGGYPVSSPAIFRYRRVVHEIVLNGLRRPQQLRGRLRPVREAVRNLLR